MNDRPRPKIAAVCCTYHRPKLLGQALYGFLAQTWPNKELVILDDGGTFADQRGDGWELVSTRRRFRTLGEKRNAAISLVSPDVEFIHVWDDDDYYLAHALTIAGLALRDVGLHRPGLVLHPQGPGRLEMFKTGGLYHGGWSFRRSAWEKAGGYPCENNGEDQMFLKRLQNTGVVEFDSRRSSGLRPAYIYRWQNAGAGHLSGAGADGYEKWAKPPGDQTAILEPVAPWDRVHRATIDHSKINPRPF